MVGQVLVVGHIEAVGSNVEDKETFMGNELLSPSMAGR